jgi:hypothetical protein
MVSGWQIVRQLPRMVLEVVTTNPSHEEIAIDVTLRLGDKDGELRRLAGDTSLFGDARIQKTVEAPRWTGQPHHVEARINPCIVVNDGPECTRPQTRNSPLHVARRFAGEQLTQQRAELDNPLLYPFVKNGYGEATADPATKRIVVKGSLSPGDVTPHARDAFGRRKVPGELAAKEQQGEFGLNDERHVQIPVTEQRCDLGLSSGSHLCDVAGMVVIADGLNSKFEFEVIGPQTAIVVEQLPPVDAT